MLQLFGLWPHGLVECMSRTPVSPSAPASHCRVPHPGAVQQACFDASVEAITATPQAVCPRVQASRLCHPQGQFRILSHTGRDTVEVSRSPTMGCVTPQPGVVVL